MTAFEVLSAVIAALGLVGGAFGFFFGWSARAKAAESQALAARAQSESAEALKRIAKIWERMAAPPEPSVEFEIGATADNTVGWIRNVGLLEAHALTVAGYPEAVKNLAGIHVPVDLAPGELEQFSIDERLTLPIKQVEVAWTDERSVDTQRKLYWLRGV